MDPLQNVTPDRKLKVIAEFEKFELNVVLQKRLEELQGQDQWFCIFELYILGSSPESTPALAEFEITKKSFEKILELAAVLVEAKELEMKGQSKRKMSMFLNEETNEWERNDEVDKSKVEEMLLLISKVYDLPKLLPNLDIPQCHEKYSLQNPFSISYLMREGQVAAVADRTILDFVSGLEPTIRRLRSAPSSPNQAELSALMAKKFSKPCKLRDEVFETYENVLDHLSIPHFPITNEKILLILSHHPRPVKKNGIYLGIQQRLMPGGFIPYLIARRDAINTFELPLRTEMMLEESVPLESYQHALRMDGPYRQSLRAKQSGPSGPKITMVEEIDSSTKSSYKRPASSTPESDLDTRPKKATKLPSPKKLKKLKKLPGSSKQEIPAFRRQRIVDLRRVYL